MYSLFNTQLKSLHLDPCLKFSGEVIRVVEEAKVLGILFDGKLTFIPHIKALKARRIIVLSFERQMVASTDGGGGAHARSYCNSIELL